MCYWFVLVVVGQCQQCVFGVVGVGMDYVVVEFFGYQCSGIVVDGLGDGCYDVYFEQCFDYVVVFDCQFLGQIGYGDGVVDGDVMYDWGDWMFEIMCIIVVV